MNIDFRNPAEHPIYFDPEWDEIVALTKSFDTLRCALYCDRQEKEHLLVASGYGNTHSSLARALGEHLKVKPMRSSGHRFTRLSGCFIIYEERNRLWFNLCDFSGKEKTSFRDALQLFNDPVRQMLEDIVVTANEYHNFPPTL